MAFTWGDEGTMPTHTVSSRDFARNVGKAKRLATDGPVFITDRGRLAFALLKIEDYYRIVGKAEMSLMELMDSMPRTDGSALEAPPRAQITLQIPDFD